MTCASRREHEATLRAGDLSLSAFLAALGSVSPLLVWGLVSRGLGLVFLVAFLSLARQVVPIAGREGIAPVVELLSAMRRDFSAARFPYFPTLLHLRATERVGSPTCSVAEGRVFT